MKHTGEGYLHNQISDVLNEPEAQYKHVSIHTEEDRFVRSGLFKQLVTKIYDNHIYPTKLGTFVLRLL